MGKEEDAPRPFIPLVRDSSVVVQESPWLPDDIELVHEKHRRVLRSWEKRDFDELSLTLPSTPSESFRDEDDEELKELYKTRRRTVLLVVCFSLVCAAAVGAVFVTVRLKFGGRSQSAPSTGRTPPAPSEAPTEKPTQRPTSDLLSGVSDTTPSATAAPTMVVVSSAGNGADGTDVPTAAPTRVDSETDVPVVSAPTASPTADPLDSTAKPTTKDFDAVAFGLETPSPSRETTTSSQPTQANSVTPSLKASPTPIDVTDNAGSVQPSYSSSRTCNGLASNCYQRVNELMFATLHNAMSTEEDGFSEPSHSLRLEVSP